jgi:hypothetical protein
MVTGISPNQKERIPMNVIASFKVFTRYSADNEPLFKAKLGEQFGVETQDRVS